MIDITRVPFNQFLGIVVSKREGGILEIPEAPALLNHLGTVHASALMGLAEATSGELMLRVFREVEIPVIPVVRRFETKFKKPASGAIYSKGEINAAVAEQFLATLNAKGRALLEVNVNIYDAEENHAMTATVEWFVVKQDASPRAS
jgi:acyl-coenzyme A thioesterase PaaI-like protein